MIKLDQISFKSSLFDTSDRIIFDIYSVSIENLLAIVEQVCTDHVYNSQYTEFPILNPKMNTNNLIKLELQI